MAEEIVTQGIVYGAAFLGTLTRTLIPFWEKLRENPELVFEKKFIGTAVIALATSAVIAATLFVPMLELVKAAGDATLAAVFFIVFTAALGTNELINWGLRSRTPPEAAVNSGTTTTVTKP